MNGNPTVIMFVLNSEKKIIHILNTNVFRKPQALHNIPETRNSPKVAPIKSKPRRLIISGAIKPRVD